MYIGLDIGGSKMLGGLFEGTTLKTTKKIKTPTGASASETASLIVQLVRDLAGKESLQGIGIGIPGSIDKASGTIRFSPNLPFDHYPLGAELKKAFSCPIAIDNDVNVGLLGEHWVGAAKNYDHVIGLFIGTGVGGALILGGKLFSGAHQIAGEIGHMKVMLDGPPCNCGEHGCLEALAGKAGIQRQLETQGYTFDGVVKSSWLKEHYQKDNKDVKAVIKTATLALGEAIGSLTNMLDPEAFILGGGVMESMGDLLLKKIREHAQSRALVEPTIKLAALGDHSILYGAVKLVS